MCRYLLITGCLCIMLFSGACKKTKNTPGSFNGKVVLMACGVIGIDIEGTTGTGGGAPWTTDNGVTFNNVVSVSNFCYMVDKKLKTGDTITFNITEQNVSPGSNCAVAACFIKGPGKSTVYVTDVAVVN